MKKLIYFLSFGFVLGVLFTGFAGRAHAQASNPQWKVNVPSSTITPINPSLQVPCANVVGGCNGSSQPLGTTSSPTFAGINATGNATSASISTGYINGYYYLPTPSQLTAGTTCGNTSSVTDAMTCMQDIYNVAPSGSVITAGPYLYTYSGVLNVNRPQDPLTIECSPNGTVFNYTGSATSTFWNYGSSAIASSYSQYPNAIGPQNCIWLGPNEFGTSTWGVIGGTNGAEGFAPHGNRFVFWGLPMTGSTNFWMPDIEDNEFIGNGQNLAYNGGFSGSGERMIIRDNLFGDVSSTLSNLNACVTITGANSVDWENNSNDDCGVTVNNTNSFYISGGHSENPQTITKPNSPAYQFFTFSGATNFTMNGLLFYQDASSTTSTPASYITVSGSSTGIVEGGGAILNPNDGAVALANFANVTSSGANVSLTVLGLQNVTSTTGQGFVYVADTQPLTPIYFYSSSTYNPQFGQITFDNGSSQAVYGLANNGSASTLIGSKSSNSVVFETGGSEKARLTSGGDLDFGTSTAATTIWAANGSVRTGASASSTHGCYEVYDSVNTTTIEYIYPSSGVLTTTSTKPAWCQ